MRIGLSRRDWLSAVASTAVGSAASAPAGRVSVAHCTTYDRKLVATLDRMFDQLGGLARIVSGKTVAIKVNLTSVQWSALGTTRRARRTGPTPP